jgi:hypothetical protein
MSYPGLNTYMINSHGDACSPGETIDLPKNVFVIMNCEPELTFTNHLIDAFLWKFACKYNLKNKPFSNVDVYKKYIGSLLINLQSALHNQHSKTNFCLFSGKCPNIRLNFKEKKFRTGLYQLPVQINILNSNNNISNKQIDQDMLDSYIQRMNVIAGLEELQSDYEKTKGPQNVARIKQDLKFLEGFYGYDDDLVTTRLFLTNDNRFHVADQQNFDVQYFHDLKSVVDTLAQDGNSLHFIVMNACRQNTSIEHEEVHKTWLGTIAPCVKKVIENASELRGGKRVTKRTATKKPTASKRTSAKKQSNK